MKEIVKYLIIYLAWNCMVYGAISFYYMTLNPVNWGIDGRFIFSMVGLMVGFGVSLLVKTLNEI